MSSKGHCGRRRKRDFDLILGARLRRASIKLSFSGRRMGGRSTETEILLVWLRVCWVTVSHLSCWARSMKRRMMHAFVFRLSRWQAARGQHHQPWGTNLIHLPEWHPPPPRLDHQCHGWRRFHCRWWASICNVWWGRDSEICAMWLDSAGRTFVASASRRSLVSGILSSTTYMRYCTSIRLASALPIFPSREEISAISSLIASLMAARIWASMVVSSSTSPEVDCLVDYLVLGYCWDMVSRE